MYVKVFESILTSSLAEDYQTRHIFMDLLVLADPKGFVDMTPEAIARLTNVPLDVIKPALCKLCKPDPRSRSKKDDGRRLVPLDAERGWGWRIVNFEAYRGMKDENARREYMRVYMRARRAKHKARKHPISKRKQKVNISSMQKQDANAKAEAEKTKKSSAKKPADPRVKILIDQFCDAYKKAHGRAYVVTGGKEGNLLKRTLKALDAEGVADPVAELMKAADTMLADEWGKPNASIGLWCSQINKWRDGPTTKKPPGYKPSSSVGLPRFAGGVEQP